MSRTRLFIASCSSTPHSNYLLAALLSSLSDPCPSTTVGSLPARASVGSPARHPQRRPRTTSSTVRSTLPSNLSSKRKRRASSSSSSRRLIPWMRHLRLARPSRATMISVSSTLASIRSARGPVVLLFRLSRRVRRILLLRLVLQSSRANSQRSSRSCAMRESSLSSRLRGSTT